MKTNLPLLCLILSGLIACNEPRATHNAAMVADGAIACPPGSKLDITKIEAVTGMKGSEKNGEYKITVPQHDLHVVADGFKIIPPMGLSSWVAFTPCGDSVMAMGDIIVTENDLGPVQQEVIRQGLQITAIHNHFVRNQPNVLYMHIDGRGNASMLTAAVKAVLDRVKTSRGGDPKSAKADSVPNTIDIAALDAVMGQHGEMNNGVCKYTFGRPDVALREHGIPVSGFMGFNTWAAWQGSPEKAAVCGDFAMLENEVAPVIRALVQNGIEVVAVHNHMVHENPKIFFLHYWGVGNAGQLAKGLKAALGETGKR